jgi:spore coat protein CotH
VDAKPGKCQPSLSRNDSFSSETFWIPGKQPMYYIIMTEAERARIEAIGAGDNYERFSDAQMNATLISVDGVDAKTRYAVGVRNRGEGSRRLPPNNYHINFRHDNPWKNVTAININSKYTYLQLVGSAIFRMAGLAAAEGTAVQVRVNGDNLALTDTIPSRMYGTYIHLETIDSDFTENHFPADGGGNIYKASIYPQVADMTYLGTTPADYVERGYTKGTNESENDWSDLFGLTNVLDNEPDATYLEKLEQVIDTEQWIRWYAVQTLIGNNETNLGNGYGDDYQMYCGVLDPRFTLVTYDMDTILGGGDSPASFSDSIWRAVAPHTRTGFITSLTRS